MSEAILSTLHYSPSQKHFLITSFYSPCNGIKAIDKQNNGKGLSEPVTFEYIWFTVGMNQVA